MIVGYASLSLLTGVIASLLVSRRTAAQQVTEDRRSRASTIAWPRWSGCSASRPAVALDRLAQADRRRRHVDEPADDPRELRPRRG